MEVVGPAGHDGIVNYAVSFLELLQALGVLAMIAFLFALGIKFLDLLPTEGRVHGESQMLKHLMPESEHNT